MGGDCLKDFIIKESLILIIMGCVYTNIEMIYRGYSHPSMIIVGGLAGMLAGLINDIVPNMKIYKQCLLSAVMITIIEYIAGYILNVKLNLNIWDYSNLKYNIGGQVSIVFSFFWIFLSYFAIKFDDLLKTKLCTRKKDKKKLGFLKNIR